MKAGKNCITGAGFKKGRDPYSDDFFNFFFDTDYKNDYVKTSQ